ncbi:MAG TPA: hypothetical protein VNV43_04240 [Candidatus Acidoferrales bacterium]|jgi:hypothetical protein|nr:hypothetical protein [Candidatus Acidoferrales bacterium]
MTLTAHRVGKAALAALACYFAVFTLACWICGLFFGIAFGVKGFWDGVFADSGEVLAPSVFAVSFFIWRWSRPLAIIGFLSCLLWILWALLPRF